MKIPYGISNFEEVVTGGFYFVDKTKYIPLLEDKRFGRMYSFFIRPRRFGKSLFLSLLEYYYDINSKSKFDKLFGSLYIGENPTEEKNKYLILKFDFSGINTQEGLPKIKESFHRKVLYSILNFLEHYKEYLNYKENEIVMLNQINDAAGLITALVNIVTRQENKIYLLIDEYDNFTNELIAIGEENIYKDLLHGTGFVKTFYKEIKSATQSGVVSKIFITGVSPITLDDLTSGFNILKNITLAQDLQDMLGFNKTELEIMINTFLNDNKEIKITKDKLIDDLRTYYNGYLFNEDGEERIFNPDMVLYFLTEMGINKKYPKEIIDMNIRTDYEKVKRLIKITSDRDKRIENINKMKEIIAEGGISSELITNFPLESIAKTENFISIMFYMGLLTIDKREKGELKLSIPNYLIRKTYWNYLQEILYEECRIEINTDQLRKSILDMGYRGNIEPFMDLIVGNVLKKLSNRDFIQFNEKYIKAIILTYLSMQDIFIPISEIELGGGYSDIVLIPDFRFKDVEYGYIIELKYIRLKEKTKVIAEKKKEAIEQIKKYSEDVHLQKYLKDIKLKKLIVLLKDKTKYNLIDIS